MQNKTFIHLFAECLWNSYHMCRTVPGLGVKWQVTPNPKNDCRLNPLLCSSMRLLYLPLQCPHCYSLYGVWPNNFNDNVDQETGWELTQRIKCLLANHEDLYA